MPSLEDRSHVRIAAGIVIFRLAHRFPLGRIESLGAKPEGTAGDATRPLRRTATQGIFENDINFPSTLDKEV